MSLQRFCHSQFANKKPMWDIANVYHLAVRVWNTHVTQFGPVSQSTGVFESISTKGTRWAPSCSDVNFNFPKQRVTRRRQRRVGTSALHPESERWNTDEAPAHVAAFIFIFLVFFIHAGGVTLVCMHATLQPPQRFAFVTLSSSSLTLKCNICPPKWQLTGKCCIVFLFFSHKNATNVYSHRNDKQVRIQCQVQSFVSTIRCAYDDSNMIFWIVSLWTILLVMTKCDFCWQKCSENAIVNLKSGIMHT